MENPQPDPEFLEVFDPNMMVDSMPAAPGDLEAGGLNIIFGENTRVIPPGLKKSEVILGAAAVARSQRGRLPPVPPLQ